MEAYDVAIIPVIVALVGVFGKMGLPVRLLPAASLLLGVAGGILFLSPDDPKKAVLLGLVMGLTSIGAYSGVKNTIEKKEN